MDRQNSVFLLKYHLGVKKKDSKKEERRENNLMTTALFIAI